MPIHLVRVGRVAAMIAAAAFVSVTSVQVFVQDAAHDWQKTYQVGGSASLSVETGTPACWFNPRAFAVPLAGQFGAAGRNMLRRPRSAQFDPALHKDFAVTEWRKITVGVETYNVFNHPNFGVPSNTQSPLSLGGDEDVVFRDAAGNFADNVGQI